MNKVPASIKEYGPLARNIYFQYLDLLAEVGREGLSTPKELSEYIRENKLGRKYPDVSGVITMSGSGGKDWKFKGGISPHIYKYLCFDLGFSPSSTGNRVTGFTPYRDI